PNVLRWLLERDFSLQLLKEFTEVRLSIEPDAAARAAERASTEDKEKIQHALQRMQAAEEGKDDPLLSDIAFHVAILEASGNRFYRHMKDFSETALRISIRLTNQRKGVRLASVNDHKKVLDAVLAGDPELARTNMQFLLTEAMELIADAQDEQSGHTTN
ncbi:MAG: FCD domain-containing protein, partial [Gammaproteobacteria bacterium]|nr:FCD domain-containing protein [Gammaproteobacteria bacterium]